MSGILTEAELIVNELKDDYDFRNTVYDGPDILAIESIIMGRAVSLKNEKYPKLQRQDIFIKYLRVRVNTDPISYRSLLLALFDKIKNKQKIKLEFEERIEFVDDPDNPAITGITAQKPWIGIFNGDWTPTSMGVGQERAELVPVGIFIFQERAQSLTQSFIG